MTASLRSCILRRTMLCKSDRSVYKTRVNAKIWLSTFQALLDIDVQDDKVEAEESVGHLGSDGEGSHADGSSKNSQELDTQGGTNASSGHREPESTDPFTSKHEVLATPAVRGLLKSLNIDIRKLRGTGRDGMITKEDVQAYEKTHLDAGDQSETVNMSVDSIEPADNLGGREKLDPALDAIATKAGPRKPGTETNGETLVPLSAIQSRMLVNMTKSLQIPHFLYADEVNVTAIKAIRQKANKSNAYRYPLTYLPFIIKAASMALNKFPVLNARLATSNRGNDYSLAIRKQHNIGIAVDTPRGLLVPNIPDVAALTLWDIAAHTEKFKENAKTGNFKSDQLTGTTFTVSNIGSIGGTYVTPMIVENQSAILGVGKSRDVPAFDEKGDVVRKIVINLSWCADHRIIDGATVAKAANLVKQYLEDPYAMLMQLR